MVQTLLLYTTSLFLLFYPCNKASAQPAFHDVLMTFDEMPVNNVELRNALSELPLNNFRLDQYQRQINVWNDKGEVLCVLVLLSRKELVDEFGVNTPPAVVSEIRELKVIYHADKTASVWLNGELYNIN